MLTALRDPRARTGTRQTETVRGCALGPVSSAPKAHRRPMTIQILRNSHMGAASLRSAEPAARHALGSSPRPARAIDSSPELGDRCVITGAQVRAPGRGGDSLDQLPSIIAEALEALRAGAGIRPLGPPPERLTVTAEERELLDRLTRDTPDVVRSMAADVADALRHGTPAAQPLLSDAATSIASWSPWWTRWWPGS
jgi:hypothetical protein